MIRKLLVLLLASSVSAFAVNITGFGSGDFTAAVPFGTDSQDANIYSISGSDNNSLYGTISPVSSLESVVTLYLTGVLTFVSQPSSNFQIGLYDSSANGLLYGANWTAFSASGVEQEIILTFLSADNSGTGDAFTGTATTIALIGTGAGSSTINFQLDTLATTSAIPEPSTYAALFGAAALGLAVWRKRRKSA